MAQVVERVLGKDEVGGSSPPISSSCAAIAAQFFYAFFRKQVSKGNIYSFIYNLTPQKSKMPQAKKLKGLNQVFLFAKFPCIPFLRQKRRNPHKRITP